MSANTTVAPARITAVALAAIVRSGTMTSSPGPIPQALRARNNASVPLGAATQKRAPVYSHRLASKLRVSRNSVSQPPDRR